MDINKLLRDYIQEMSEKTDKLREQYPKAMSGDIIQMEKGYRFCTTETVKWLETLLKVIDMSKDITYVGTPPNMPQTICNAIEHTNKLSVSEPLKKKKSFLQVASEGAKDMASDIFRMNQMDLSKTEIKEKK